MKNTKVNLVRLILLALSFSSPLLTVSAQTNPTDVAALSLLQINFPLLALISTGDPCLPTPHFWLECSSDTTPRITALNLNGAALAGVLLPDFSAMDALEIIDLSNNLLVLEFPDFLANFPNLKVLNLANNFFFGTIPISLMEKSINNTLELTLTGPGMINLCFSDEELCETVPGTQTNFGQTPVLIDPLANGFTINGVGK
ncbi:hypothetical protein C5167_000914 [Papaver somniferum]|uniref:Leucine-rich repeat-containing N-terminal plant-type domain-containing protein n=1 Tax=Papaver somniferum TaxID=3469 RepID=A0A4Y7KXL5_PAPSO|nr:probable LRR receptor-like serine/threonine-protein kinase At5g16900 [Papaver somniferum]RZC76821.1 hypothetical protein C5167_000914 [Papaver somniferum]